MTRCGAPPWSGGTTPCAAPAEPGAASFAPGHQGTQARAHIGSFCSGSEEPVGTRAAIRVSLNEACLGVGLQLKDLSFALASPRVKQFGGVVGVLSREPFLRGQP